MWLILLVVIWSAATGPIVIRQAQGVGVPSLYIIAARLALTSLTLTPFVLRRCRPELSRLSRRDWLKVLAAGALFALNLLLLFAALEHTSVLVTNVMRRTSPLWVIWIEILFLGVVFSRRMWVGLLLTLAGSGLVGWGGAGAANAGSNPLLGALLALVGAVSVGLYLIAGRAFRQRLSTLVYSWLVFSTAGLIAIVAVLAARIPLTGYGLAGYGWILVVTLVTQFLGHIPLNVTLRYFHATHMSIIMQVAVALSALWAFALFGEVPSLLQVLGSAGIMGGVLLVSWK